MRFQRLSNKELEALEKDFVYFLSSNSVTASDWLHLKDNDPDRAEGLIEIFSDLVYEKALANAKFLEQISDKEFICYKAGEDSLDLIGLKVAEGSELNLNTPDFKQVALKGLENGEVDLVRGTKKYESREEELFELMKKGAYLTDGAYYDVLLNLIP